MKNRVTIFLILMVAVFGSSASAWADTIYTQDGRVWKGIVVGETAGVLKLDLGFDVAALEKDKIASVIYSNPGEAAMIGRDLEIKRQYYKKILIQRNGKPQEVPLVNYNGHVLVDVLLEGNIKARLLLDTGSTLTFLSSNIADRLGLPEKGSREMVEAITSDGRKQKMALSSLKSLRIGAVEANDVQVAILPQTSDKMPYIDGLLGVSFLSRFNFKIDYQRNRLVLERNFTRFPTHV